MNRPSRLLMIARARARLKLPYLDRTGAKKEPEPELPSRAEVIARLQHQLKVIKHSARDSETGRINHHDPWISELEENLELVRQIPKWSQTRASYYRQRFLCQRGLDLDTAMLLHAQTDAGSIQAVAEKACVQVINLGLIAEHGSTTRRAAVNALLGVAKLATATLNRLANEKRVHIALQAAMETDSWPVLISEHPQSIKEAKDLVMSLAVGSAHKTTRRQREARTVLSDPAGMVAVTIRQHISDWLHDFGRYRGEPWFEESLPSWAVQMLHLPLYSKENESWLKWWKVAAGMLEQAAKSGRYRENYLGEILKSKTGKPLSDRLARQALKSRFNGQAPKTP